MPIGAIVQLCFAFLSCTNEEKVRVLRFLAYVDRVSSIFISKRDGHIDLTTRALEESATADILSFGCMLLRDLVAWSVHHAP